MTTEHTVKSTAHIRDFAPDILAGHDLNATKGAAEQFVLFRLCPRIARVPELQCPRIAIGLVGCFKANLGFACW